MANLTLKGAKCTTDHGKHIIEELENDPPFSSICMCCGERFMILSETAMKNIENFVSEKSGEKIILVAQGREV